MNYEIASVYAQTYGLVYLVVVFLAIAIYALWPKNKEKFDHAAHIPLEREKNDQS